MIHFRRNLLQNITILWKLTNTSPAMDIYSRRIGYPTAWLVRNPRTLFYSFMVWVEAQKIIYFWVSHQYHK